MCYYYSVKEYASLKGFKLSVEDEAAAAECAISLSNKRGMTINKAYCASSGRAISCYAARILREAFIPVIKIESRSLTKNMADIPA